MKDTVCRVCQRKMQPEYLFCPICGTQKAMPRKREIGIKLEEIYPIWLSAHSVSMTCNSLNNYRRAWKRLQPYTAYDVGTLPTHEIQRALNALSYDDAKKMRSLLRQLCNMANEDAGAVYNPAASLILPKRELRLRDAFHRDEIQKMWDAYNEGDQDAASALIMIYTGMRTGEFLALRERNIIWSERIIEGVGTKTYTSMQSAILLPQIIIGVLHGQCLGNPEHLLVPYNSATFYKRYYAFLKRIGVRQLAPYCCQHTFATMLARNNVRPVDVQRAMRHARYETTANTYTHLESVDIHEILDKVEI